MDGITYLKNKFTVIDGVPRIDLPVKRDYLADLFFQLGYRVGAEIGVEAGKYSEVLCQRNPELHLYAIDIWESYKGYREYVPQETIDSFLQKTKERLRPFPHTIIKDSSMNAVQRFKDEFLDFVYIDSNHDFQNTTNDIIEWSKKVRLGGCIAGHDFTTRQGDCINEVYWVVNAYTQAKGISPWFITGHDRSPSWFWFKT